MYLEIKILKDNIEGSGSVENDKHNKKNIDKFCVHYNGNTNGYGTFSYISKYSNYLPLIFKNYNCNCI